MAPRIPRPEEPAEPPLSARLDVWLDIACLFKTRSEAQRACRGGKVEVNGDTARPNRLLKAGDELRITRRGRRQIVRVLAFAAQHVPRAEARGLYEDRTPPPTPAELEERQLRRLFQASVTPGAKAPDRRQRQALRRLKGRS